MSIVKPGKWIPELKVSFVFYKKENIMISERVKSLTRDSFDGPMLKEKGHVVVYCWAPWSPPPLPMIKPLLEHVAIESEERLGNKVKICELNLDENQGIAPPVGYTMPSTMLYFRDGQLIDRMQDFPSFPALMTFIHRNIQQ
jgi:thioredoxin 1